MDQTKSLKSLLGCGDRDTYIKAGNFCEELIQTLKSRDHIVRVIEAI